MTESERGPVDEAHAASIPKVRCACGHIAMGLELGDFCPACGAGRAAPLGKARSGRPTGSTVAASLLLSAVVYLYPIVGPHFVLPLGALPFLGPGGFPLLLVGVGVQLSLALAISWVLAGRWMVRGLLLIVFVPVLWVATLALLELVLSSSRRGSRVSGATLQRVQPAPRRGARVPRAGRRLGRPPASGSTRTSRAITAPPRGSGYSTTRTIRPQGGLGTEPGRLREHHRRL